MPHAMRRDVAARELGWTHLNFSSTGSAGAGADPVDGDGRRGEKRKHAGAAAGAASRNGDDSCGSDSDDSGDGGRCAFPIDAAAADGNRGRCGGEQQTEDEARKFHCVYAQRSRNPYYTNISHEGKTMCVCFR